MPFIIFTLPTLIHSWLSWFCCMAVAYQSSPQLMNSLVWFQQLRSGYFKLQRIVRARHLRFEISPASGSTCFNMSLNGCAAEGKQIVERPHIKNLFFFPLFTIFYRMSVVDDWTRLSVLLRKLSPKFIVRRSIRNVCAHALGVRRPPRHAEDLLSIPLDVTVDATVSTHACLEWKAIIPFKCN